MVIAREHGHIGPHIVHNHREELKHGIDGLTRQMSEILMLHSVGHEQESLHLMSGGETCTDPEGSYPSGCRLFSGGIRT
jgi:hypothetical protein